MHERKEQEGNSLHQPRDTSEEEKESVGTDAGTHFSVSIIEIEVVVAHGWSPLRTAVV